MGDMVYTVEKDGKRYRIQAPEGTPPEALEAALAPQPYDVSPSHAAAMNVGDALTFGFAKKMYGEDEGRFRATIDKYRKENPGSAVLGDVSGAALPALVGGQYLPWLAGGTLPTTVTLGGTEAAVRAATDAKTPEDVPFDAGRAMAIGAVTAGAGQKGLEGAGSVIRAAGGQMSRIPFLGPKLQEILATGNVARAFNRDNIDAGTVPLNMGPEARPVDYGGRNVLQALDTNATLPGSTSNAVDAAVLSRKQGARDRLLPIVENVAGTPERAAVVFNQWQQLKQSQSAPLYAKFESRPIQNTPELSRFLETAQNNGLIKRAKEIAEFETRQPFDFDPTAVVQNPRVLNHIKQALDDRIARAVAQEDNNLARSLTSFKNQYIALVDKLSNNTYKPALDAFSGPAGLQSALTQGRRFMSQADDVLAADLASLSSSERDAFRIGAAEALRQKIGTRGGRTEILNIENDNFQDKLKLVFGDQKKMDEFLSLAAKERKFRELETVNQGSQTARRMAAMEDQSLETASDVAQLVGNVKNPIGMFGPLRRLTANLSTPEPVRNRIGEMLLDRNLNWQAVAQAQKELKARQLAASLSASSVAGQQAAVK